MAGWWWIWLHVSICSLPLSSLPVCAGQDHWEPEEPHECDHQDCSPVELQTRRGAVGTGDTSEGGRGKGEREEEGKRQRICMQGTLLLVFALLLSVVEEHDGGWHRHLPRLFAEGSLCCWLHCFHECCPHQVHTYVVWHSQAEPSPLQAEDGLAHQTTPSQSSVLL